MMNPFFKGKDNYDQLVRIAMVLGTDELYQYLQRYNLKLDPQIEEIMGTYKRRPYSDFIDDTNKHLCSGS